jgi:hypothetical protein
VVVGTTGKTGKPKNKNNEKKEHAALSFMAQVRGLSMDSLYYHFGPLSVVMYFRREMN